MNIIQTPRLILRTFKESDFPYFVQMNQDPLVMEHFPNLISEEQTRALLDRINQHYRDHGFSLFAVELKETHQFIGFIGLLHVGFQEHFTPAVEIGWRLDSAYWNLGFATEGAKATLDYAFNHLKLPKVVSFTATSNKRSQRIMQKIGMKHNPQDNFAHPKLPVDSPLSEHVLYTITKQEFESI